MGCRALESCGFSVVTANDGAQALERFLEDPDRFVAVVLDLSMPERDGLETLREIRARAAEVPVLLISGYGDQELTGRTQPDDRLGYLSKPFRQQALIAKLEEMLD